ncbi:MAG: hypothetical protein JEZ07_15120 [Phycisphaerae bacterium]|nr:hypothetical protein [Phycisphaerae bacterium]
MTRIAGKPRISTMLIILILMVIAGINIGIASAATDATLTLTFTPQDAGGSYNNRFVMAAWITDMNNNRICTIGTGSGKVALWANTRASSVYTWYNNNPTYRTADKTDRTGATQNNGGYNTAYTVNWDCKMYNTSQPDGTILPDGQYKLWLECSNGNGSSALNVDSYVITKGQTAWTAGPVSGTFKDVVAQYTPATLSIENNEATNITSTTARLNGTLTGASGNNTSVYIYWGDNDGGLGVWDNEINLGTRQSGDFFADISGLEDGTTYYYRCKATTSSETVWSNASISFEAGNIVSANVFKEGDIWKYFKGTSTPAGWTAIDYNDTDWLSGPSGFGYGDGDDNTVLSDMEDSYITVYLRKEFTVPDPSVAQSLTFTVDYDDGFVAFLNGTEVARIGVAANQTHTTTATSHEAGTAAVIDISNYVSALVAGKNIFAIEVHNQSIGSSDLSMIPTLDATVRILPPIAKIEVNPEFLQFESTPIGQSKDLSFTIVNDGDLALEVTSLEFVGIDTENFTFVSPPSLPLTVGASGASSPIIVRFTPNSDIDFKGCFIAVGSNAKDIPAARVALSSLANDSEVMIGVKAGLGGNSKAVAVDGSYTYLAQGAMLTVLDTSGSSPVAISQVHLAGIIESIILNGDTIYAAIGTAGIQPVNITNIMSPIANAPVETAIFAYESVIANGLLCIADGSAGVSLYNIDDPLTPNYLNSIPSAGPVTAITAAGSTLYFLDSSGGLKIYSLQSGTPTLTASLDKIELGSAISVDNGKAYIADKLGNLFIVDVSGTPTLLGQMRPTGGMVSAIEINGEYAFLASATGLTVVNIQNPALPAPVSQANFDTGENAYDLVIDGTNLSLANAAEGLRIIDITNPLSPIETGNYQLLAAANAVNTTGSLSEIVAAGPKGVQTIDMTANPVPQQSSLINMLGDAQDITISDSLIYIANGSDGMSIIDISTSDIIGNFPTDGFARSISVAGNLAAVSDGDKVYFVNITTADSPSLISQYNSSSWAMDVYTDGTYAYIANGQDGLAIVNASDASLFRKLDTTGFAYGIAVADNIAYVADGYSGVQIIDISNPAFPALLNSYNTAGIATDVVIADGKLCIADRHAGIVVLDISIPAQPKLYAADSTLSDSLAVAVAGSKLMVADKTGGLVMLGMWPKPTEIIGDLNADNILDVLDIAMFASQWLASDIFFEVLHANLNQDDIVNLIDFNIFTENWLLAPMTAVLYSLSTEIIGDGQIQLDTDQALIGETINIIAVPKPGYRVKAWHGTKNDSSTSNTNAVMMDADKTITVEFEENPADAININSITVKAGKSRTSPLDSISIKATLPELAPENLNQEVDFLIFCGNDESLIFSDKLPIDTKKKVWKIKKDNFSYKVDFKKNTFQFSGKKMDLTGLSSPIKIVLQTQSWQSVGIVYDGEISASGGNLDVINGKNPVPIQLLLGIDDTLGVKKVKFKLDQKKPENDTLKIQGTISVKDTAVDIANQDVLISWGNYSLTLAAEDFSRIGNKKSFKYKKSNDKDDDKDDDDDDDDDGTDDETENEVHNSSVAAVIFDLEKCTFKISIKNADIGIQDNPLDFAVKFSEFDESYQLNLQEKKAGSGNYIFP